MHPSSRRAHGICFDRVSRGGRARRCAAAKRRAGGRFCSPRRPSATRRPSLTSSSTRPSSGAPRPAAPRRRSAALRLRLRCRSGAARGFARCSSWEAAGGGVRARSRGGGAPSRLLCGCAESDQKVAGLHSASSASRSVLAPQPLQLPARRWACSCWSTGFSGQPLVFPDGIQPGATQGPRLGRRSHTLELETARRRPGALTAGELRRAPEARCPSRRRIWSAHVLETDLVGTVTAGACTCRHPPGRTVPIAVLRASAAALEMSAVRGSRPRVRPSACCVLHTGSAN